MYLFMSTHFPTTKAFNEPTLQATNVAPDTVLTWGAGGDDTARCAETRLPPTHAVDTLYAMLSGRASVATHERPPT